MIAESARYTDGNINVLKETREQHRIGAAYDTTHRG